jgi:tRNA pseudouridine32 synthase / 23S rRNA pseudouridine746 synthase
MKTIMIRHRSQEVPLSILYEDMDLIIINKPTLMLSVPGRNSEIKQPRNIEWHNAIQYALNSATAIAGTIRDNSNHVTMTQECHRLLHLLNEHGSIPRKKSIFDRWVSNKFPIESENVLQEVWENILRSDKQLHLTDLDTLPLERISAQELLQQYCGDVVAVHRLDCETSGALIYAKSDEIAGALGKLFQTRQVSQPVVLVHFDLTSR